MDRSIRLGAAPNLDHVAYTYDGEGHVTQLVEPNGRVTTTKYDADGHVLQTAVDPLGLNLVTSYTYDLLGHVLTETQGSGSANPLVTQYCLRRPRPENP